MRPFTRIRIRVLAIVLLAIVPAMALLWHSADEGKRRMSREAEGNALRLSRFLASDLERDLAEGEVFLAAVAGALRSRHLLAGGCADFLRGFSGDSPVYANVGLAGPDGKILRSVRSSPALPGLGALEWFPSRSLSSARGCPRIARLPGRWKRKSAWPRS